MPFKPGQHNAGNFAPLAPDRAGSAPRLSVRVTTTDVDALEDICLHAGTGASATIRAALRIGVRELRAIPMAPAQAARIATENGETPE